VPYSTRFSTFVIGRSSDIQGRIGPSSKSLVETANGKIIFIITTALTIYTRRKFSTFWNAVHENFVTRFKIKQFALFIPYMSYKVETNSSRNTIILSHNSAIWTHFSLMTSTLWRMGLTTWVITTNKNVHNNWIFFAYLIEIY
jgi:hypothetical protein